MPPRRPPKRPNDGDDERRPKKAGKGRKEPTYETYDEALDGGVEMEEKGERYRDGDKAQRFYEKAAELYDKAYTFSPTFDAAYNRARVLYTLSTSFHLPPLALTTLRSSLLLYRHSLALTNSPLLHMDAGFNLAQALSDYADMLEDTEGSAGEEVVANRAEAIRISTEVFDGQEAFLSRASPGEEEEGGQGEEVVEAVEGGAETGQAAGPGGMDVDEDADDDDEGPATFETHLPTPSSLIDTLSLLVALHLSLWTSAVPTRSPSEAEQTAVRVVLDRAAPFCPAGRQAELDLLELRVLLAVDGIVWDLFRSEARAGSGIERSLDGAVAALSALLANLEAQPPEDPTVRADLLVTLAETHQTIAYRALFLSLQLPPGPNPLAQAAWFHLSQTVHHLGIALDLPTSAGTPRTFKASVLLGLSKASLGRARLEGVNDTAKRNWAQLMENARTYAQRAAEALGWKGVGGGGGGSGGGKVELPERGGWDTEVLGRAVGLQQLRNCFWAGQGEQGEKERWTKEGEALVDRMVKGGVAAAEDHDRRFRAGDVRRFVEEVGEEEEGWKMDGEERGWWVGVAARLG